MNTTIKIKPIYRCKHCNKTYRRKIYYNRHVAGCEILSKTSKGKT